MGKKVIISSFHSGSYFALTKLDYSPDVILSFDSHLDFGVGGVEFLNKFPKLKKKDGLKYTYTRNAVHLLMKKWFEGLSEFVIFHSEDAMKDTATISDILFKEKVGRGFRQYPIQKRIEQLKDVHKKVWGVQIVESPPTNLLEFTDFDGNVLIDIDIDYFSDMQTECYSYEITKSLINGGKSDDVLLLIEKIKPELITISEVKTSALGNESSKINFFLKRLEGMGYEIERFFVFNTDEEATKYLQLVNPANPISDLKNLQEGDVEKIMREFGVN